MFKLINDDCRNVMRKMVDDNVKVDLTVTSPPYDNLREYNKSSSWNFDIFKEIAQLLYDITADGGVVVWIVNDATINGSETGTSFKQALYFKEIGFNLHDTMIYRKKSLTFPDKYRYYHCFEYMFVFSKGKPKTINLIADKKNKSAGTKVTCTERNKDGSLRTSSGHKKGRKVKEYGVRWNIWEYATGNGISSKNPIAFKHPAIFPLDLAKDHILSWSNPNDIVFDCFAGSGTTGVACLQNNRKFIGVEIDEEYYKIAKQRCGDYQSKLC